MKPDREIIKTFLKNLIEVFKNNDADLGGCGCCGSPSGKVRHILYKDLFVRGTVSGGNFHLGDYVYIEVEK